jgi:hypothetical protein
MIKNPDKLKKIKRELRLEVKWILAFMAGLMVSFWLACYYGHGV